MRHNGNIFFPVRDTHPADRESLGSRIIINGPLKRKKTYNKRGINKILKMKQKKKKQENC
jgi:hypothetical protein